MYLVFRVDLEVFRTSSARKKKGKIGHLDSVDNCFEDTFFIRMKQLAFVWKKLLFNA
jgi:hypothetical protein